MDVFFACSACDGTLVARSGQRGLAVICPHCHGQVEFRHGKVVTEAVADQMLHDLPALNSRSRLLRRVRPIRKPALMPHARISRVTQKLMVES
jgi:hypothetical protein